MLLILAIVAASYLLGAVPFGYLIGRWAKGIDIRQHGSGNIGATNLGRTVGWKWFPLALALDFAKGALPVALVSHGGLPLEAAPLAVQETAACAGLAAMLGHLFSVYLGFKGGKGVATGAGVIGVLLPWPTLFACAAFGLCLVATRYVSLSSIVAAVALAGARFAMVGADAFGKEQWPATALVLVGALLIIWRHRSNVRRLLAGTEPKLGDGSKKTLAPEHAR